MKETTKEAVVAAECRMMAEVRLHGAVVPCVQHGDDLNSFHVYRQD
jgi:hypothetical protein